MHPGIGTSSLVSAGTRESREYSHMCTVVSPDTYRDTVSGVAIRREIAYNLP